jgi:ureidoacrylate peracid hydrolase
MQNAYASQGGYLDLAGFDVSATRPVIDNIIPPSPPRAPAC